MANRAEPAAIATPERPNRAESCCAGLLAVRPSMRYAAWLCPRAAETGPCAATGKLNNPSRESAWERTTEETGPLPPAKPWWSTTPSARHDSAIATSTRFGTTSLCATTDRPVMSRLGDGCKRLVQLVIATP
jgi:hypothetical protein